MIQDILVILIVAVTLVLAIRWVMRTAKGRGSCHCGSCHDCPLAGKGQCHCK